MILNYYLVYEFVKRISRPFSEWEAFKSGVIDKDGNILLKKRDRSADQKRSYTMFDNLVRNIKRVLGKIPGGSSRLATFTAALYLIKEHNMFREGNMITESQVPEVDFDKVGQYVEEVITSAGTIDSTGFMSKSAQKRWTKRNAETQL